MNLSHLARPPALALAAVVGACLAEWLSATPVLAWAIGAVGMAGGLWQLGQRAAAVAAAVLLLSAGWARAQRPPQEPIAGADDRGVDQVIGTVRGPVETYAEGTAARVVTDDGMAVWVSTSGSLVPGDRVWAAGRLRTPRGFRNPGAVNRARVAAAREVSVELSASVLHHQGSSPDVPWRWAHHVAARWSGQLTRLDQGEPAALVRGAVVGQRAEISEDTQQQWRDAGVYHVLSVSGLHLGVVALLAFAVLRRVVAALGWLPSRPPALLAGPVAAGLAAAYTAITGAETATVRALVVVLLLIVGRALARSLRFLDALGAAALALVLARPVAVFDPSFQLSFGAASVLALVARADIARARPAWQRRLLRAGCSSLVITAVTSPITAFHFGAVSWGGVIGNLCITPVVELVVIPLALIGLVLGDLVSAPGQALLWLAVKVGQVAMAMATWLAPLTPSIEVTAAELALWSGTALVVALVGLMLAGRLRVRPGIPMLSIAVVMAIALGSGHEPRRRPGELLITFLDVGQGDAAIVETPGGQVWLVDAGGTVGATSAASAAGRELVRVLRHLRIEAIDLAVVSHPHPDHYGGLMAVSDRLPVRHVWVAATTSHTGCLDGDLCFARVMEHLQRRGALVASPPLGLGAVSAGARLRVLAPAFHPERAPLVAAADPVRSVNDNSLVVMIEYRGRRILFLGDLEREGEEALALAHDLEADVVKVAHHGSRTSSSWAIVEASSPRLAVVSVGQANRYGLPNDDALARWRQRGVEVLRTDRVGAVAVRITASGELEVSSHDGNGAAVP
jgi:competence protein ComEC